MGCRSARENKCRGSYVANRTCTKCGRVFEEAEENQSAITSRGNHERYCWGPEAAASGSNTEPAQPARGATAKAKAKAGAAAKANAKSKHTAKAKPKGKTKAKAKPRPPRMLRPAVG